MKVFVRTRVKNPRPTATGVRNGIDYDAELWVQDEVGEVYAWHGGLTYAPDHDGRLVPYGNRLEMWMEHSLSKALNEPWIAAHRRLVEAIVASLGGGEGNEEFEVEL